LTLPGHGHSAPAASHAAYSLPGYAAVVTGFGRALGATDAVIVGWSLGGHIVLEAAPALPRAARAGHLRDPAGGRRGADGGGVLA
jgi:pimeloyl-ACP methyl ester carboxylesterase